MKIANRSPFCLFKGKELGIAHGYFAGDCFAAGGNHLTEVSGQSFGWYDSKGVYYCDSKHHFTRPTIEQIERLLTPELKDRAIRMNLLTEGP